MRVFRVPALIRRPVIQPPMNERGIERIEREETADVDMQEVDDISDTQLAVHNAHHPDPP